MSEHIPTPASSASRATAVDLATCPQCGGRARQVPAGVTKAGKRFTSFFVCREGCTTRYRGQVRDLTWVHAGHWRELQHEAQPMGAERIRIAGPPPLPPPKQLPTPIPIPWDRMDRNGRVIQGDP